MKVRFASSTAGSSRIPYSTRSPYGGTVWRNSDSALHALINGHLRALEHLRASREDALRRIAARRGLSFEETEATYRGLHLPAPSDTAVC